MALTSDSWWIESFRSFVDYNHTTEIFVGGLNALANMFYKLAILIWQMFDTLLAFLGDTSGIKALSKEVFKVSSGFYNNLYSSLISLFILVIVLFSMYVFVSKNERTGYRTLGMFFLIVLLNYGFFANGEKTINGLFDATNEVQETIVKSVKFKGDSEVHDDVINDLNIKKDESEELRNALFEASVQKTFSLINFGTMKYDSDRMDKFLIKKEKYEKAVQDKNVAKLLDEAESQNGVVANAVTKDGEVYMNKSVVGWKVLLGFLSIPHVIITMLPSVLFALINFLLRLILLGMVLLAPIMAIVSLIPTFNEVIFRLFRMALELTAFTIGTTFASVVIIYFFNVMDNLIISKVDDGNITLLVGLILKFAFLKLLFVFKDKLIALFTANKIKTVIPPTFDTPIQTINNVKDNIFDKFNRQPDNKNSDLTVKDEDDIESREPTIKAESMDIEATNIEQDRDLPENNLSTQSNSEIVDINSAYDSKLSEKTNDLTVKDEDNVDLNIREDIIYDRLSDVESTELSYVDDVSKDRKSDDINYSLNEHTEDVKSTNHDVKNRKENNVGSDFFRNSRMKEKMQEDTSVYDA